MTPEFAGKVCVVTGGGAGIGRAVCRAFAAQGARVAVLDKNRAPAETVASSIEGAIALTCDVTDSGAVDSAIDTVTASLGSVDVLVNCAGIIGGAEYKRKLDRRVELLAERERTGTIASALNAVVELTDAQWRLMLSTHLDGTFYCSRAVLRHMQPRRSGAIVNMSSVVGLDGGAGVPHYAAAKAGIIGLTRAIAQEVAPLGIRVNAVAPGFIETAMRNDIPPVIAAHQIRATPLGRLGTADEIADAVLYLAGERASFMVGQIISPNGGFLSR